MSARVPARLQPWLALGLLLLVIGAVAAIAVLPVWRASARYDAAIAAAEQRLAVQRRVAATGAGLEARLAQLRRGYTSDASYLRSTSRTLAAAELQGIVKRAILAGRGEILSTEIVGAGADTPAGQVTLAVTMRATLEQIVAILHRLETGQPLFFIDHLRMRTQVVRRRNPNARPTAAPLLDVQFELSGYLRGDVA
jgi:general secretion pathway protein M